MPVIMPMTLERFQMSNRVFLPGRAYKFLYPAINFECLRLFSPMVERRILVSQIRDTASEPLDEETLEIHPYTNRGRWLITGIDLEKFEERSFYFESMVGVIEVTDHKFRNVKPSRFCRSS